MHIRAIFDIPAGQDRQRRQDAGEQDHNGADAVNAQRPARIQRLEPGAVLRHDKLIIADGQAGSLIVEEDFDGQQRQQQRQNQRNPAPDLFAGAERGQRRHDKGAERRAEDQNRERVYPENIKHKCVSLLRQRRARRQNQDDADQHRGDQNQQQVLLNAPGLHAPQPAAEVEDGDGDAVADAVNQPEVQDFGQVAQPARNPRDDMQDGVNNAAIEKDDDLPRQPLRRLDEDFAVDVVQIIAILEQADAADPGSFPADRSARL